MHQWDTHTYAYYYWHPVAATSQLHPGEVLDATVLDQPLLLSWPTGEHQPRAFRNRCPHRGVAFRQGGGTGQSCRRLVCPYHGWTYNLRGELLAADSSLLAGIRSYKGVRNILDNQLDQLELEQSPATPLPTHANVRGESYYN